MTLEEALAWLRGERSWTNTLSNMEVGVDRIVAIQQADAATTEQAYWTVRAHREGLLEPKDPANG